MLMIKMIIDFVGYTFWSFFICSAPPYFYPVKTDWGELFFKVTVLTFVVENILKSFSLTQNKAFINKGKDKVVKLY